MRRLFTILVVATLFALSGSMFAQNLITNGGFEAGTPGGVGFGGFFGWTPVNETDAHFNSDSSYSFLDDGSFATDPSNFVPGVVSGPHSGNYMADFGAVGLAAGISQTIATTNGANYVVSFWLANDDGANAANDSTTSIDVDFGGTTLISTTDQARFGWTQYSFLVTATGSSSDLTFDIRQDPSYYYLDDVSVVQTPEPAALGLLFSGLSLGAGALRKFRS